MNEYSGFLLYKCRRCGEIEKNPHSPDTFISLEVARGVLDKEPKEWFGMGMSCGMIGLHTCKDGNMGIHDLIGAELDKPRKEMMIHEIFTLC